MVVNMKGLLFTILVGVPGLVTFCLGTSFGKWNKVSAGFEADGK